jgi:hypothetical protein
MTASLAKLIISNSGCYLADLSAYGGFLLSQKRKTELKDVSLMPRDNGGFITAPHPLQSFLSINFNVL